MIQIKKSKKHDLNQVKNHIISLNQNLIFEVYGSSYVPFLCYNFSITCVCNDYAVIWMEWAGILDMNWYVRRNGYVHVALCNQISIWESLRLGEGHEYGYAVWW